MNDSAFSVMLWLARAAVVAYGGTLILGYLGRYRLARTAYTVGYLTLLAHIALAFHLVHDWSHAAAYEATARQSAAAGAPGWGSGIYAIYGTVGIWGIDLIVWWRYSDWYHRRPRWIGAIVHGWIGFITFNAAVIFATGPARYLGIAICILLASLPLRVWRQPT